MSISNKYQIIPDLIISVDTWNECMPGDIRKYSRLFDELSSFGSFLNFAYTNERDHGAKICHYNSSRNIDSHMASIDIEPSDMVLNPMTLDNINIDDLNSIIITGFHFGRCIHSAADALLSRKSFNKDKTKIYFCLNLSLIFPNDSWNDNFNAGHNYCMWSHTGFEQVYIK